MHLRFHSTIVVRSVSSGSLDIRRARPLSIGMAMACEIFSSELRMGIYIFWRILLPKEHAKSRFFPALQKLPS